VRLLAERGRVSLDDPASIPSSAPLRALAKVRGDRGDDEMVAVFDYTKSVAGERVTEAGVRGSVRDLYHPRLPGPDAEIPDSERPHSDWSEDEEDEDDVLDDAVQIVVEEIDRFAQLAKRGDPRAIEQLEEVLVEVSNLRQLVVEEDD
jgi:hypothetical protein